MRGMGERSVAVVPIMSGVLFGNVEGCSLVGGLV